MTSVDSFDSRPIGIFDSGVGGISVANAIRQCMPNEQLIYVADTINAPYGEKSDEFIYQRMAYISQRLLQHDVKAIVVACNTATTAAIARLRLEFNLPIIGVEPGIKPAVLATKTGVIGVLATPRTLKTPAFANLTQRFSGQAKVLLQPCPDLVLQIETLAFASKTMDSSLNSYIKPLLNQGADTLVLGCTHYNFIAKQIAVKAGPEVTIIRTEMAVAKCLQQKLYMESKLSTEHPLGQAVFITSGDPLLFKQQVNALWQVKADLANLEIKSL